MGHSDIRREKSEYRNAVIGITNDEEARLNIVIRCSHVMQYPKKVHSLTLSLSLTVCVGRPIAGITGVASSKEIHVRKATYCRTRL